MTAIRAVGLLVLAASVVEFVRDRSPFSAVTIGLTAVLLVLLVVGPLVREPDKTDSVQAAPVAGRTDDSVAKFTQDLKERLLAGPYRSVTAFADNYALTGVSRSTTYAAISGTRLPTDGTVEKLLGTVVRADKAEIHTWLTRRAALDTTLDPSPDDPASAASSNRRSVRLRDVVVIAVGLVVLAAGASTAITLSVTRGSSAASPPAPAASATTSPRSCSPTPDLRSHQVSAHVANTQGEGTYARMKPQTPCHTGFLSDGEPISVVCQDLRGPVITDVYQGTVRDWPVWDKLASGAYVSDLYVDLPKSTRPALVDQLPAC